MKKIFVTASAICLLLSAQAQFTYDYLKAADDYYHKADYYSAAQYYEKYLAANGIIKGNEFDPYAVKASTAKEKKDLSNKEQAIYNLAESYLQLNYYVKAEPFLQQAAGFDDAKFPLADYHYATTLRALGKFEEAEKAFTDFLSNYKTTDQYSDAARREIQNLRYIQAQLKKKDLSQYTIAPAAAFAAEGANYAPVWASANTVYFTTTRPDGGTTKKEFVNKVYGATYENGSFVNPMKLALSQPGDMHQGGVSISADGNSMFITRWRVSGAKTTASIYSSHNVNGQWSEPALMNAMINAAGATNKQPFIMPDGKLLFASDRSGGQGGFDLYMADLNANGEATVVTSLGPAINTPFDEEAPYYHAASNTLVFATNGRVGMGGFDLFFSKQKDGAWSEPENFGYPVNSVKNDMYFASKGTSKNILADVLLSSDRSAECCLQMFALSKIKRPKLIAGSVVDCKTNNVLAGAKVEVKDAANNTVFSGTTTAGGAYNFTVEDFATLQINGALRGYTDNNKVANAPENENAEGTTLPVLCLNKIPEVGTVEVLDNVYFEYNKAVVLEESHASLDKLVRMLNDNPTVSVEISGHTDNIGNDKYNQKLSEERAKSVVEYLIAQGIEKSRLMARGYGRAMPVAPNTNPDGTDNPDGRAKNRRTEFKVIKN